MNGSQLTPSEWLLAGIILFLLIVIVALIYIGRRIKRADDFAKLDAATGALNSEGLTHAAAKQLKDKSKAYAVVVMQLKNYRQLTQTFGGENSAMHLERVRIFSERVIAGGWESVAAFCHGGTIDSMLEIAHGAEARANAGNLYNGSVTVFSYENGRWTMEKWASTEPV